MEVIDVEPIEVQSLTSLEVSLTPATLSDNLATIQAQVEQMVAPYLNVTVDPEAYDTVKEARKCMADLNKMKAPITGEFRRIKEIYLEPLNDLKRSVDNITAYIDTARAGIKAQVDEADAAFRDHRMALLEDEYAGYAGAMAEVIPFEAVLEDKWLTRSVNEVKAVNELCDKTQTAVKNYETLKKQTVNHPDEVMKRFAETLNLGAALELENELNQKDAEMAAFKQAQAEAEAVKQENMAAETPSDTAPIMESPTYEWELSMGYVGTREQAEEVIRKLKSIGFTGGKLKCKGEHHV